MTAAARRWAPRLGGIAAALLLWELGGRALGDALLAPPSLVLPEYGRLLREGRMLAELAGSLRQMLVGFGLAFLVGTPLGVVMGRSRVGDAVLHPWVSMFVVTSVASLVPLFIVLVGTGFWFRVAVVFVASVGYIMLTTYQGARGIEPRWLEVGRAFSAGGGQLLLKVILPALYPYVVTGARLGLVHAIRAMVVAEMFIIVGYGGLVYNTGLEISTAPVLALLVTLMVVGVAANQVLRRTGRAIAPWYEERRPVP
jgi:ABC-type nitrate/sulfonate/bicarbonate transport system permease component